MPLVFPVRRGLAAPPPLTLRPLKDRLVQPTFGHPRRRAGGAGVVPPNFFEVLTSLGLTTNLKLCVDPGDILSYDGSSQTLADRSGTQDFWLGADATVATDDPAFVGTAGAGFGTDQYFLFDGGDVVQAKAQPAYIQELHKDSALWSAFGWVYVATTGAHNLFGTSLDASGSRIGTSTTVISNTLEVWVGHGLGAPIALYVASDATPTIATGAWHFFGCRVDEAAATAFFYLDGGYRKVSGADTFNATYLTPASGNDAATLCLGATGAVNGLLPNGARLGPAAIVQGTALAKADFDAVWDASKGRFGL